MEHIGDAEDLGRLQYRPAIKRKPLSIIRIVCRWQAVEGVTVKEWRVFDKIKLNSRALSTIQNRAETVLVVKRNGHAGQYGLGGPKFSLLVARQIDGYIVAQGNQGFRQRAYHVCKSAGLGKGYALGSSKYDIHQGDARA